ncbi:MAG: cation-transporting P-type ATPase [Methanothrix sp.]
MKPAKTKTILDSSQYTSGPAGGKDTEVSKKLQEKSHQDIDIVFKELETGPDGLSQSEADSRLKKLGPNEIAREKRQSGLMHSEDLVYTRVWGLIGLIHSIKRKRCVVSNGR